MIGPSDAFVWGSGGAQLTPTQIDAQRKVAQALMAQGSDYSPVQSWTQGASRVAQAIFGGMQARDANEAAKSNQASEERFLASVMPGASTAIPSNPPAVISGSNAGAAPMGQTSIPSGEIDPRLSSAIGTVASSSGVDPAYMTRLAMVENGGKVEGGSPLSSAQGPFQFLRGTAKQYGLANPNDPVASADAAARLTLDNKAALTSALGREPTPGELYLAHQQGSGGAIKLLQHPDAPVESVIGRQAAHNNAAAPGMTAGQFANKWTSRFSDIGQTQAAQAAPTVNPGLAKAMASPYISAGTKQVLGLMLHQQMEAAQKANDPLRQIQIQEGQAKLGLMPLEAEAKRLAIEESRNKLTPLGAPTVDGQGNLLQKDALGKVNMLRPAPNAPSSVAEYNFYADQEAKAGREPKPFEVWDLSRRRSSATNVTTTMGGGSDKQVFDTFAENTKEARAAATGLTALRNARQAIQGAGGAITGAGADGRLMLQKVGAAFGVVDPTAIQNTETFRAAIAPQVAAVMKATVGTAQISNTDREFAMKAAGGSIDLDSGTINRLLDIMERASLARLDLHRQQLDAVYPDPEKNRRERALFGVQMPEAPKPSGGKTSSGLSWSLE